MHIYANVYTLHRLCNIRKINMKDCLNSKEKFWYIINFSFCKIKIFNYIHYRCIPNNNINVI